MMEYRYRFAWYRYVGPTACLAPVAVVVAAAGGTWWLLAYAVIAVPYLTWPLRRYTREG
ncbi:MAG: hypothetical protein GW911_01940 [Armatimonadetes bacterium]|nr:hypothetical protein [Armatimonadota bacterium]NCP33343.1 hypothetical protein [Armatimonadota bacterium]NCQ31850.1 hypothetical protein [Armatimonadota bacterium]NDK10802.1 hypothetical protein [Armatimonadota bacterium]